MTLEEVKGAIDNYLASGADTLVPAIDDIIRSYVDNVCGFKEMKENANKVANENKDIVTKEEVDGLIDEERRKIVDELKNKDSQVRKEFENKVTELKAGIAEIKSVADELGKELKKSIAEAVVPTSLGPVAPNPISSALRLYINATRIKRSVDGVLIVTSKVLGQIVELGLDETPLAESITKIAQPLISIKEQANTKASSTDAVGDNPDPTAGYTLLKKDYIVSHPTATDGKKIDGNKIEEETKSKFGNNFPLSRSARAKFDRILYFDVEDIYTNEDRAWAQVILKYDEWYVQNIK